MLRNRPCVFGIGLVIGLAAFVDGGASAHGLSAKSRRAASTTRDCIPINGRFGYYGNPWCDTGSYRLEDIEFRERQRAANRKKSSQ